MDNKGGKITKIYLFVSFYIAFLATTIFFLESKILIFLLILFQVFLFFIVIFKRRLQIKKAILFAPDDFSNKELLIDTFPFPVIIIDKIGNILRCNILFKEKLAKKDVVGESIFDFINPEKLNNITGYESINVNYKNKKYTVFAKKTKQITTLYFFEDTYYKISTEEYLKSKVAVALITFDNKNEMLRNNSNSSELQIIAKVEEKLQNFAVDGQGFLKKIGSNSYLIFLEEKFLKICINEKFKILQTVKEVKNDQDVEATISIGIGRNGENLKEIEYWARKALEMALGRGGDQVVIKTGSSYVFFGGISSGTQNRSKVKARVIASILSNHIKECDKAIIMGHKFSDLDSVGASIGVYNIVKKAHNKEATILIDEKHSLASKLINSFKEEKENIFSHKKDVIDKLTDKTLLIIVDTHNPKYLESQKVYEICSKVVVIDHHRLMENKIKNALVFYHEPYASSACEMVTELIYYLSSDVLSKKEAEALLSGIMLDTKNFIAKTSVRAFEAAAFLKRKNADTAKARAFFFSSSEAYKEKYKIASKAEFFNKYAIAMSKSSLSDIKVLSAQVADELLEIEGIKASFVLYLYEKGVGICARSFGEVNVQIIMEKIGGGGHHGTAGTFIPNISLEEAREKLVEKIEEIKIT